MMVTEEEGCRRLELGQLQGVTRSHKAEVDNKACGWLCWYGVRVPELLVYTCNGYTKGG